MSRLLVRMLLSLYPAELRRVHGAEMLAVAEARRRRELRRDGLRGRLRFWSFLVGDLVRALPEAWMQRRQDRRAGGPGRRSTPAGAGAGAPAGRPGPPGGGRGRSAAAGGAGRVATAFVQDAGLAMRQARRAPVFAATVVVVLAVGIGANTAIFSAVHAALLREPPYPEPGRLFLAHLEFVDPGTGEVDESNVWSYPKFVALREHGGIGEALAGYTRFPMTMGGRDVPVRVDVEIVTPGYFRLLGVAPERGGLLADEEDAPLDALLSHGLWQMRFGGEPGVVGSTLTLEGQPLAIRGVMPRGFGGLTGAADLWIGVRSLPVVQNPRRLEMRFSHWLHTVGRLPDGTSLEATEESLAAVEEELDRDYRWEGQTHVQRIRLESLASAAANPQATTSLAVLMAAVVLVLLVTCANVAGLMLARDARRSREAAIRAALGAGRGRLLRQHLTGSLVLTFLGGLGGIAVAAAGIRLLAAAWPDALARGGSDLQFLDAGDLGLDPAVLGFAVFLTVASGLVVGILPALRGARHDLTGPLKQEAGTVTGGRGLGGRWLLAGGQLALATVLLTAAGLLLASLYHLQAVDAGFDAGGVLSFRYRLAGGSPAAREPGAFHTALVERLEALPGVRSAAVGCLPLTTCDVTLVTRRAGRPPLEAGDTQAIMVHFVSEGYFETLGIELRRGRGFTAADRAGAPWVAVINEAAARTYFGSEEDALGSEFAVGVEAFSDGADARVVGVAEDVLHGAVDEGPFPVAYFPVRQIAYEGTGVVVDAAGDPLALVEPARRLVADLDPGVAVDDVATMERRREEALAETSVVFDLLALFSAVASTLAALGVYGVMALSVARRTRELGVRTALGARPEDLARLVVGQAVAVAAAGLAVGMGASLAVSRALEGLLFEVRGGDPLVLLAVAVLLLVVAAVAAWLPVRRATRVDPLTALRAG